MSKKRSWALASKCRLSKALADYKEHRQKRRGLKYLEEDKQRRRTKSKGPNYCKKLKGDHKLKLIEERELPFFKTKYTVYECIKCHKQIYKNK